MSNRPDTGDADEDKKTSDLLALLYPDEGAEVDASAYEGDEELAGFRDLRAMLADASDEEPSAAVSNKLLALAAQHAPKPKTEPRGVFAWLGNLMMPLVAHPGLAAAAALVLVAGVAGTLYIKGDVQIAEPTASSRGQSPEGEAAPAEIAPDPESSAPATATLAEEVADESENDAEGVVEQSPADGRERSRSADSAADKSKSKKRDENRKAKPAVVGGSSGYGYQDSKSAEAEEESEAPARSGARSDSLKVKDIDTRDLNAPSNNPSAGDFSAPPPPKAEPSPRKSTSTNSTPTAPSQDADDDAKAEAKESKAQQATRLHEQARIAAKNKDCTRVLALGQQIRKLDGAYYDRKFLSDEALKSCRASANKKGL